MNRSTRLGKQAKNSKTIFDLITSHAKPGSIILESSTLEPSHAKSLSKEAESKGFHYIDGPVSGGVNGATHGNLIVI